MKAISDYRLVSTVFDVRNGTSQGGWSVGYDKGRNKIKLGKVEKLGSEFLHGYAIGILGWMVLCHLRGCVSPVPAF